MREPSVEHSGFLRVGRTCLCLTLWSRPREARLLRFDMDSRHPVLEIEKKEGQVQRVLLADASLCSKSMQLCCRCSTGGGKVVVLKLSNRKRLFFKATDLKETDEWMMHLEAAISMLAPPKEEENLAPASPSAELVGNVELYETWGSELLHGKAWSPHPKEGEGAKLKRTNVGDGELHKLLKSKQNHDVRHAIQGGADVNANLTRPSDVYALSEGCTTWKRVNGHQGSAVGASCVEEADEILLGASGANVDAPTSETTSYEVPSWLSLIKREESTEADMAAFEYDEMFKEAAEMEENIVPKRAALINSILRQLIQTMNPSKVRLPACVLECRSLLQSYGSAFGRSDLFTSISKADSPQHRLERVAAFYLSQLKCMKPTRAALKPYNPTLGEIFVSKWPVESKTESPVFFLAEQVSHHPPVSAVYAECRSAGTFYYGSLATIAGLKCKYLVWPDVMTVENRGQATMVLVQHDERFTFTFPRAEACDLLGSRPWLQLAGETTLTASTGASATFSFSGKDMVEGELLTEDGDVVATFAGSWRGQVDLEEKESGRKRVLLDMNQWKGGEVGMEVAPVACQEANESKRLWRKLTKALLHEPNKADEEKANIENLARRRHSEEEYTPRFFEVRSSENDNGVEVKATFKYPPVPWHLVEQDLL